MESLLINYFNNVDDLKTSRFMKQGSRTTFPFSKTNLKS